MTTDQLLEEIPEHLSLARRNNLGGAGTFRMLSFAGHTIPETEAATGRECLIKYLLWNEEQRKEWNEGVLS
jgi:hypothetical protein